MKLFNCTQKAGVLTIEVMFSVNSMFCSRHIQDEIACAVLRSLFCMNNYSIYSEMENKSQVLCFITSIYSEMLVLSPGFT